MEGGCTWDRLHSIWCRLPLFSRPLPNMLYMSGAARISCCVRCHCIKGRHATCPKWFAELKDQICRIYALCIFKGQKITSILYVCIAIGRKLRLLITHVDTYVDLNRHDSQSTTDTANHNGRQSAPSQKQHQAQSGDCQPELHRLRPADCGL